MSAYLLTIQCPDCRGHGVILREDECIISVCCGHASPHGDCCGNPVPELEVDQWEEPCPLCEGSGVIDDD